MVAAKISRDVQEKIGQLQLLQQRLSAFSQQKQQFQIQQVEVENALLEVKKTKKPVFTLVGGVLIEKKAAAVRKTLEEKKKDLEVRIKSLEKQESKTQERVQELQSEVAGALK